MNSAFVKIDCARINDWKSFHDVFADAFGFPSFYGRNLDAWIDCMTSLDAAEDGMTELHCAPGAVFTLQLENVRDFRQRCPEQYTALIECAAFVNWRRNETGEASVLALSFLD
jgi:barstar (barnase inhibitor)